MNRVNRQPYLTAAEVEGARARRNKRLSEQQMILETTPSFLSMPPRRRQLTFGNPKVIAAAIGGGVLLALGLLIFWCDGCRAAVGGLNIVL